MLFECLVCYFLFLFVVVGCKVFVMNLVFWMKSVLKRFVKS